MSFNIIPTWDSVETFIEKASADKSGIQKFWDQYVVDPIWKELSQWAPFDISFMKPQSVTDIDTLRHQITILKTLDIEKMEKDFNRAVTELPKQDNDTILTVLFPGDNKEVLKNQNGVTGAGVFGNISISINPIAPDFRKWIKYVFSHEYHHSVWGSVWYGRKQSAKGNLLEALLTEGQADSFALSLYPDLKPAWISNYSEEDFKRYLALITENKDSTDRDSYSKYIFGNKEEQLPWCIGYSVGYTIIQNYKKASKKSFLEMLYTDCDEIYEEYLRLINF